MYGDREGNIAHFGYGKIPKRAPGPDWKGVIAGNQSKHAIREYHDFEALPKNENPASGFVFNTNNSAFSSSASGSNPKPGNYDKTMGFDQWENNRSLRFLDLISEHSKVDYGTFKQIKYDITLPELLEYPIDVNPLFDPAFIPKPPQAQRIKAIIESWDRTASISSVGPAHLILTYQFLQQLRPTAYKSRYRPTAEQLEEALVQTDKYLTKHFRKIEVTLGEFQFLVRGDRQSPIWGMPDVLAAIHSGPYKQGRRKAIAGESHIMMIRYPSTGWPIIETVNVYGASNQPESPHYADQMDLFLNQELKPMTLDWDVVRAQAVRAYHPE